MFQLTDKPFRVWVNIDEAHCQIILNCDYNLCTPADVIWFEDTHTRTTQISLHKGISTRWRQIAGCRCQIGPTTTGPGQSPTRYNSFMPLNPKSVHADPTERGELHICTQMQHLLGAGRWDLPILGLSGVLEWGIAHCILAAKGRSLAWPAWVRPLPCRRWRTLPLKIHGEGCWCARWRQRWRCSKVLRPWSVTSRSVCYFGKVN